MKKYLPTKNLYLIEKIYENKTVLAKIKVESRVTEETLRDSCVTQCVTHPPFNTNAVNARKLLKTVFI